MKMKDLLRVVVFILVSSIVFVSCGEDEQVQDMPEPTKQTEMKEVTQPEEASKDTMKAETEMTEKKEEKKTEKIMPAGDTPETYEVQNGETLESIAEKFYGDSEKWFYIFAENERSIDCWNNIYPGQKLIIPELNETENM